MIQAQAARREKESVPALVERAREVINRRMERMPAAPTWQAPYQRQYHPSTAAQPEFEQSEADHLRAAAVQAVSTASISCLLTSHAYNASRLVSVQASRIPKAQEHPPNSCVIADSM